MEKLLLPLLVFSSSILQVYNVGLGDDCTTDGDCSTIDNAKCSMGVCDCMTGYSRQDTSCSPVDCGSPVFAGYVLGSPTPNTIYGATVEVSFCDNGYGPDPSTSTLTCGASGAWSEPAGCGRDCGSPVFAGYVLGSPTPNTFYGATVEVSFCDNGYGPDPSTSTLTCGASGAWSEPAGCGRDCGSPVFAGYVLGSPTPNTFYGATVEVSFCDNGYGPDPSTSTLTCGATGAWSEPAGCGRECPVLTPPTDGSLSTTDHYEGTTVTIACNSGFSPVGDLSANCSSGFWSPSSLGTCKKECSALAAPDVAAGSLSTTDHYEGITVTLTCNAGYTLVGISSATCSSGTWSDDLGTCEQECPALTEPATVAGTLSTADHYEGISVTLSCNSGYTLVGESNTICSSGSWSQTLGTCEEECPALTEPATVAGTLSTADHYEGISVTLSCNSGYTLVGESNTICSSGSWSQTLGTCEEECSALAAPDVAAGSLSTTDHYEGITVTLTCNAGYTLVGISSATCSSGTWSDDLGTCEQECPALTEPATVAGTLSTADHYEGISVTLSCNSGYTLVGKSNTICSSGSWSQTLGTCEEECPALTEPATVAGTLSTADHYEGISVTLSCNSGYTLVGESNTICSSGSWSQTLGTCEEECSALAAPDVAAGSLSTTDHYEGITVTLTCNAGNTLVGISSATCSSGTWSDDLGTCEQECPALTEPATVAGTLSTADHYEGISVTLSCNSGYTLVGESNTICSSGSWSQTLGTCEEECSALAAPDVAAGSLSTTDHYEGITVTLTCNAGYTLVGISSATCSSRTWSDDLGTCEQECPALTVPATVAGTLSTSDHYEGISVTLSCNSGYTLVGESNTICSSGSWIPALGTCEEECGIPAIDSQAYVLGTIGETTFGKTVPLTCSTGYKGTPDPISCGSGGVWSNPTGCVLVDCGTPSQPGYTFTTSSGTLYLSEAVVAPDCKEGYIIQASTATVTCGADGSWSNAEGCTPVDCGPRSLVEGYSFGTVAETSFGTIIPFICAVGYNGISGTITCSSSATWSDPTGCAKVNCGDAAIIAAGYMLGDYATTDYQSTVDIEGCATGYSGTVSIAQITCLSTGIWSELQGCEIVDCGQPDEPVNGRVNIAEGTKYGAQVTQSCDLGYKINGFQTIECLHTGAWSSGPVTCSRINCLELIPPLNGIVSLPSTEYGSTATFSCDTGFELVAEKTRQCLSNGEWSNANPNCQIKGNCGVPPVISYASVSLNDVGSVATYACVDGYTLVPSDINQLTCASTNVWTGTRPQCKISSMNRGLSIILVSPQITLAGLNDPAISAYRKKQVQVEIQRLLRRLTGIPYLRFVPTNLRSGSLIIEGDIILPDDKASTENYLTASSTMVYNDEPIVIDGQEGTFQSITVVNETFTKENMAGYICKAYEQLEGPCESGYECVATSTSQTGSAECRSTSKTDNLPVILGVGIGVPVFLMVLVIIIVAAKYLRRHRPRDKKYGSETDSNGKSQFAHQIAPRYHRRYGYMNGYEGPRIYELDSTAYSDSRRFNSPWYYDSHFADPARKMYIERPKY